MDKPSSPGTSTNDKCLMCRGCIDCDEMHCMFHSHGNPDECHMDKCKYCEDFLKRNKSYLNNVG